MRAVLHWIILATALSATLITAAQGAEPAQTEVIVISALHGAHKNHASYDYDTLFSLVEFLNADFIGVELRPEDIGREREYLSSKYPYEMIELATRYPETVFGVDWLGSSIEGGPIPEEYFANLEVLKLSAVLNDDQAQNASKPAEIAVLQEQQSQLV